MRYLLLFLLFLPFAACAQYPTTPIKTRLGYGTTADGLVYRGGGAPTYTPSGYKHYAYVYLDSLSGDFYAYYLSSWNRIGGVDWYDSLLIDRNVVFGGGVSPYLPIWDTDSQLGISIARQSGDSLLVVEGGLSVDDIYPLNSGDSVLVWRNGRIWRRNANTIQPDFGGELSAANVVYGSGTPGNLTKWATDSTLTDAIASDNGSLLTIAGGLAVTSVTALAGDSILVWRGNQVYRRSLATALASYPTGSGAANRVAYWSGASTLTSSAALTYDGTTFSLDDANTGTAKPLLLDSWTDAGAPTAVTGQVGYNTTSGNLVYRGASAWEYPVKSSTETGLFTAGSVLFADANGRVAQDNPGISWESSTNRLTIRSANDNSPSVIIENTSGSEIGRISFLNSTVNNSVGIGIGALANSVLNSGVMNVAVGPNALTSLTTGDFNTVVGKDAGRLINTASHNTLIGYRAGEVTTASSNTFVGSIAGAATTSGNNNVALGRQAMSSNTTGSGNTVIGYRAGRDFTGSNNLIAGALAAQTATSVNGSIILGYQSAPSATTLFGSIFIGNNNITTDEFSVVIGGRNALNVLTSSSNVIIGYDALYNDTTASQSVAIGRNAGFNAYGSSANNGNIFLGYAAGPSSSKAVAGKMYIANSSGAPTLYADLNNKYVAIGQEAASYSLDINSTNAVRLAQGTTAQRPTGVFAIVRGNSDSTAMEYHDGTTWRIFASRAWSLSTFAQPSAITWTLAGDSGTPQAVASTQTATVAGGWGINTVAGATRTVTVTADSTEVATQHDISDRPSGRGEGVATALALWSDANTLDALPWYYDSGLMGVFNLSPGYSLDMGGVTDGLRLPNGTTAQRPTNAAGVLRWNTTDDVLEVANGTGWDKVSWLKPELETASVTINSDSRYLRLNNTAVTTGYSDFTAFKVEQLYLDGSNTQIQNILTPFTGLSLATSTYGTGGGTYARISISASSDEVTDIPRIDFGANNMIAYGSPQAVGPGRVTGQITYNQGARIYAQSTESHAANKGSKLVLATTPNGSSAITDRMVIDQNGFIGMGISTPLHALDIKSTEALGLPVGTTGQRGINSIGALRYNTTLGGLEVGAGSSVWNLLAWFSSGVAGNTGKLVNSRGSGRIGEVPIVYVESNGNVGINAENFFNTTTSVPQGILHLKENFNTTPTLILEGSRGCASCFRTVLSGRATEYTGVPPYVPDYVDGPDQHLFRIEARGHPFTKISATIDFKTDAAHSENSYSGRIDFLTAESDNTDPVRRMSIRKDGAIQIFTTPANDDALTQVLVRDASTGTIKYRNAASLMAPPASPRMLRHAYTSDADLTISADTLAVALEHRIYMEVTSGASSATEVTIPDAGAAYLHTSIAFTCKDDSSSYACIVNTGTATIIDTGTGMDVSTYTITAYKTVVFRMMQTGASSYRWAIQD